MVSVIATERAGMPHAAFVTQLSYEINFADTMNQFKVNNTRLNKYLLRYIFVNSKLSKAFDVVRLPGPLDRIFITARFFGRKMINIRDRRGRISSRD